MGNIMKKEEVQVLIEGCPGSGKSCALFRLKKGERLLTPTPGTTGFFVESVWQAGTKLNVWEVHGEDEREKCFPTSRALCFVVDCTENLAGIERAKAKLHATMSALASEPKRKCFTVLVFANKQDVPRALSPSKLESTLGLGNRGDGDTWRWKVQGCSATQGTGLKEGMDWLAVTVQTKRRRGGILRKSSDSLAPSSGALVS